jgi:hypothetical protein
VVCGVRVPQIGAGTRRPPFGQQWGDEPGLLLLPGVESGNLLVRRELAWWLAEEEVGDLDGVALGPHGHLRAGPVDEHRAVRAPAAGQDFLGLPAGSVAEVGELYGQTVTRGRGCGRSQGGHSPAQHPGGVAAHDRSGGNVLGDDGTGRNHGSVTDLDSVEHD